MPRKEISQAPRQMAYRDARDELIERHEVEYRELLKFYMEHHGVKYGAAARRPRVRPPAP